MAVAALGRGICSNEHSISKGIAVVRWLWGAFVLLTCASDRSSWQLPLEYRLDIVAPPSIAHCLLSRYVLPEALERYIVRITTEVPLKPVLHLGGNRAVFQSITQEATGELRTYKTL